MEFLPILQYNSTSVQLQYNKKSVANQGICCNTCHTLVTKSISTSLGCCSVYNGLFYCWSSQKCTQLPIVNIKLTK